MTTSMQTKPQSVSISCFTLGPLEDKTPGHLNSFARTKCWRNAECTVHLFLAPLYRIHLNIMVRFEFLMGMLFKACPGRSTDATGLIEAVRQWATWRPLLLTHHRKPKTLNEVGTILDRSKNLVMESWLLGLSPKKPTGTLNHVSPTPDQEGGVIWQLDGRRGWEL